MRPWRTSPTDMDMIAAMNQTASTPAVPAISPERKNAAILCVLTENPNASMRRLLSRIACRTISCGVVSPRGFLLQR